MIRVRPASMPEVRQYFATELKAVLERKKIVADHGFDYVVDLLVQHMDSEQFFQKTSSGKLEENVLALLYGEYLNGKGEEREKALKRLGDICLLVTGIFPSSLQHKLVGLNYYFGMGGAAYQTLSGLQFSRVAQTLFLELSQKFQLFSSALSEVSEATGLQKNSDLLSLYERWLATGDERLRARLIEKGIVIGDPSGTKTPQ